MASGAEFDFADFDSDAAAEVAFAASFDGHADPCSCYCVCLPHQSQAHSYRRQFSPIYSLLS